MSITLTKDQEATKLDFIDFLASPNKYMIIQGASGCGKSTLIRELAEVVEKHHEMYALLLQKDKNAEAFQMILSATTNQAAAVLGDLTGMRTKTIHAVLGATPRVNFKTGKTQLRLNKDAESLRNTLLVIDEGSMIDDVLGTLIDLQTESSTKVVIIGDWFQLAPVGQAHITMQETSKKGTLTSLMNQIMRNSGAIQQTGVQFRNTVETGIFTAIPTGCSEIVHATGPEFQTAVDKAFTDSMWGLKTCKVLAWTNARVLQYNNHIRKVKGMPADFTVGETVLSNKFIRAKNFMVSVDQEVKITGIGAAYEDETTGISGRNYELNNQHSAFMADDQNDVKAYLKKTARLKDWEAHYTVKDTWLDLRLPYASTVHKSQGSTYDSVFIDLGDIGRCGDPITVARMLYVAITRARHKVVLYGQLPKRYAG